jgi:glycerate 2-kinase
VIDLESIYRRTLAECKPKALVRTLVIPSAGLTPRTVVAVGKCAGPLLDGVADELEISGAFAAIPHSYPDPRWRGNVIVAHGGHPDMDRYSFHAGDALLRFVDESEDVLFLISGGGSACVESPLPPFTRDELIDVNRTLVASDLPIGDINTVRKHLSAIKGGRLGARVRGRSKTLVYSDVSTGALADVASGPTIADTTTIEDAKRILRRVKLDAIADKVRDETVRHIENTTAELIADNTTLTATAARAVSEAGYQPVLWPKQMEMSVVDAAAALAERASSLPPRQVLVAGGEMTVVRRGNGKGGRCCELAVRFALRARNAALFGSSDGVDGTSGVAGVLLSGAPPPPAAQVEKLLQTSDSLAASELIGRTIIIPPTGNNLRDLFLVAADNGAMAHD